MFLAAGAGQDDLIDFVPDLRQRRSGSTKGTRLEPASTAAHAWSTIVRPGRSGGANWWSGAFDPVTGRLYVRAGVTIRW